MAFFSRRRRCVERTRRTCSRSACRFWMIRRICRRSVSSCVSPGPRVPMGALVLEMGPHAGQPRQQIFILRELHLQPALLCAGALGENIENESAPVHDAHAELFLDRPRLRGRELVVDHNEIALVVRYDLLYFLQFARAEKAARVGRLAGLQNHGDRVRARGIHERGKLLHRNFGGALLGVHARCGKPREHRPFSFLRQVLNG